ncbi:DUF4339 domain-containing protein, partial [Bacteriovoracaceae bacterium]|nr:DUF4339 domain-containing protein [Bacteriovoracaceae bacterium]
MSKIIDLAPITEEEVAQKNLPLESLWLVNYQDEIFGPFEQQELKAYSLVHDIIFEEAQVCNIADGKWIIFYECGPFQRRRPQIVDAAAFAESENFYYIKQGQKIGPISFHELKAVVDSLELTSTDQISSNGRTWIKIYQHPEFDRRDFEDKLPFKKPIEDSFMSSNLELIQSNLRNSNEDALADLAYIGHKRDKGFTHDLDVHQSFNFKKQESEPIDYSKFFKNKFLNYSVGSAFVIICLFVFFGSSNNFDPHNSKVSRSVASKRTIKPIKQKIKRLAPKRTKHVFKRKVTRRSPIKKVRAPKKFQYRDKPKKKVVRHNAQKQHHDLGNEANLRDPRDE